MRITVLSRLMPLPASLLFCLGACAGNSEAGSPTGPTGVNPDGLRLADRATSQGWVRPANISVTHLAGGEGFDFLPIADPGRGPVLAVRPDGTLRYAWIDPQTEWPMVAGDDLAPQPLPAVPGTYFPSTAVGMIAGSDGTIHLVWDAAEQIYYTRLFSDNFFEAPTLVAPVAPARSPTLALSPTGDPVVAFTRDIFGGSPPPPAEIIVARGVAGPGAVTFSAPVQANPGCCIDAWGSPADHVSGPSLAVGPDDAVHIVFEWMTVGAANIDHLTDATGTWQSTPVAQGAFVPCPSLVVDQDGAHITYLLDLQQNVWYVNVVDGQVSLPQSLYTTSTWITMALMQRDHQGILHVSLTEDMGSGSRLLYLNGSRPEPTTVVEDLDASIHLTPAAGGTALGPSGSYHVAYEHWPIGAPLPGVELASGP